MDDNTKESIIFILIIVVLALLWLIIKQIRLSIIRSKIKFCLRLEGNDGTVFSISNIVVENGWYDVFPKSFKTLEQIVEDFKAYLALFYFNNENYFLGKADRIRYTSISYTDFFYIFLYDYVSYESKRKYSINSWRDENEKNKVKEYGIVLEVCKLAIYSLISKKVRNRIFEFDFDYLKQQVDYRIKNDWEKL